MKQEDGNILLRTKNAHQVQKYLSDNARVDLMTLKDANNNTLLHLACTWDKIALVRIYLQHEKDVLMELNEKNVDFVRKKLEEWVNETNSEGFTALHYASYNNDLELIRVLEDLKANQKAETQAGLTVLHMAAQSDAVDSFIHYRNVIDINTKDSKGMTPLHWAAYMCSERIAAFLLSLDCDINAEDDNRDTPLHLAALYGNTRIVRRLLMKGADRHRKNNQGETPLRIAQKNEFVNISRMLKDDYGLMDYLRFYLNVQIRYEPQSRNWTMPLVFLMTAVLVIGSCHALLKLTIESVQEYYILAPVGLFYIVLLLVYISLLNTPKPLPKGRSYDDLLGKQQICTDCLIPKPPRSYHCDVCKTCVLRFDHHCPWISGCVGQSNLKRFILFLVMLLVGLGECATLSMLELLESSLVAMRFELSSTLQIVVKVILGIDFAISALFFAMLLSLIWVQLSNLCLNRTTFERYSKSKKKKPEPPNKLSQLQSSRSSDVRSSGRSRENSSTSSLLQKSDEQEPEECSCRNCVVMCSE